MIKSKLKAEPGQLEAVMTSTLPAPREKVFAAYMAPHLIPAWWGPEQYKTVVEKMEVRAGGVWRFIQYDADGNEFAFHGVYHEIVPPERVVSTFEYEGMPGHVILSTVRFEEQDGQTVLIDQSVFQSVEDRDGMLREGMQEGGDEGLRRLVRLLVEPPAAGRGEWLG